VDPALADDGLRCPGLTLRLAGSITLTAMLDPAISPTPPCLVGHSALVCAREGVELRVVQKMRVDLCRDVDAGVA
jgi:hypothetical protein